MRHPATSPYAAALGDRIDLLHPSLRTYFSAIPAGSVGVGEGVFHRVGMRHRALRVLARPLERRGVVVAGWHSDVPFRVENRTVAGRALAERTLHLPGGDWVMRDAVARTRYGRVVDEIGEPALVAACFDVEVIEGGLQLRSRAVGLRLGRLRLRVPRLLSPVVRLSERADEETGRQQVSLTIDVPLLGRVYEYHGDFTYRLEGDSDER